jgi:pSer/pThr/pTyr-binding forkhead associated (FHA) protein
MKWALVVDRGKQKGTIIPIRKSPFLMGREDDCHLRTANSFISHHHCELRTDGEKITIRDCHSTNGTFINDLRVDEEEELHEGDRLKIGSLTFVVCHEQEKASESAPADETPIAETRAPEEPRKVDEESMGDMLLEEPQEQPRPQEPRKVDEDAIGDMLLDLDEEDSGPPPGAWKKNSSPDVNPERPTKAPQPRAAKSASSAPDIASKMLKGKDTSWIKPK